MAEEKPAGNPWEPLLLIGAFLLVLFVLWWIRGGPRTAQLSGQGFFMTPTAPAQSATQ